MSKNASSLGPTWLEQKLTRMRKHMKKFPKDKGVARRLTAVELEKVGAKL